MRQEIRSCFDMLNADFNGEIRFEVPVIVKKTPHHLLIKCNGAINKDGRLMVIDSDNKLIDIYLFNENISYVINSINQKLKWLIHLKKKENAIID